jgi:hypothetical protein
MRQFKTPEFLRRKRFSATVIEKCWQIPSGCVIALT